MSTLKRIKEFQNKKEFLISEILSYANTNYQRFELEMLVINLILAEDLLISNQNLLAMEK